MNQSKLGVSLDPTQDPEGLLLVPALTLCMLALWHV